MIIITDTSSTMQFISRKKIGFFLRKKNQQMPGNKEFPPAELPIHNAREV